MTSAAFLVAAFIGLGTASIFVRPRNAPDWLICLGAALPAGLGITSLTFFFARLLAPANTALPFVAEVALAVTAALALHRTASRPQLPGRAIVAGLLLIAALATPVAIAAAGSQAGDWDAWAIWNFRARFLASASTAAHLAWSANLTDTHPEYPLLLSATVARLWTWSGTTAPAAPQTIPVLMIGSALVATLGASTRQRGPVLGAISPVLLALPALPYYAASQYADIPLAMYFLLAAALFAADEVGLASLCAGLAAWTKDEGLAFAGLFLLAAAVLRPGKITAALAGIFPGLAATVYFKAVLAPHTPSFLANWHPDRLDAVLAAMRGALFGLGGAGTWYHPVYPLLIMMLACGFARENWRAVTFTAILAVGMNLAYIAAYLTTPYDFRWQLSTSVDRLAIQSWPLIALTLFLACRTTLVKNADSASAVRRSGSRGLARR